jgi:hypothetical protein
MCQGMNMFNYPFGYFFYIGLSKPLTHLASVVELREMFTLFALPRTRRTKPTSQRRLGDFGFDGTSAHVN